MTTEETREWIKKYFKEQWVEVQDCDIDFSKHEPINNGGSLHIHEERYHIGENVYRLLYVIGEDSDPIVEILNK